MTDIVPFLKSLISAPGLSAYEEPVLQIIRKEWAPLVDELSVSRVGSLQGLKRGTGKGQRPAIMLSAHMDAIGLIASAIVDGFIQVYEIGGTDARLLPGTPVRVHGRRELRGVVVAPPPLTLPENKRKNPVPLANLMVDVGLPPESVKRLVSVGDLISFDTQPMDLAGDTLSGHSLDNRASVAAVTICLQELQGKEHAWDVWAVATVQEEESYAGAASSAYALRPDMAIAVDVTHAKGAGTEGWQTMVMGKAVPLGWGANLHPFLFKQLESLAKRLEIPTVLDPMPQHSGTDAFAIQVARNGIPSMLISIPLRYMHTPVEVVAIKDVQRVGRLMAEFIKELGSDFASTIRWDDEDAHG